MNDEKPYTIWVKTADMLSTTWSFRTKEAWNERIRGCVGIGTLLGTGPTYAFWKSDTHAVVGFTGTWNQLLKAFGNPLDSENNPLDPESIAPGLRHPRQGYVVALYIGVRGRMDEEQVLIEIYETYNTMGDERSKSWHYTPYDLSTGQSMETKTIGFIGPPEENGDMPPTFVLDQFAKDFWWRRLR
jgi:hypothetical protein